MMGASIYTPPAPEPPARPIAQMRRVAASPVYAGNVWHIIVFDTIDFDNRSGISADKSKYTIPEFGTYALDATIHIGNAPNPVFYGVRLMKNGNVIMGPTSLVQGVKTSNSRLAVPTKRTLVVCDVGDILQVEGYTEVNWQTYQTPDGTVATFTVERVL